MPDQKFTLGGALTHLRQIFNPDKKVLSNALGISYTTYLKTERGQRELSFLMALKICRFYNLDVHDLIAMLHDDELNRDDYAVHRFKQKAEKKKLKEQSDQTAPL